MRTQSVRAVVLALLICMVALAVALPMGSNRPVLADDKGKTEKKAEPKEVPASCARIISGTERQRCIQKSGG